MFRHLFLVTALLAARGLTQTFTSCQPLNETCPANDALGTTFSDIFNGTQSELSQSFYNVSAGASLMSFGNDGVDMQIIKSGDSVTAQTSFYIMWGSVEIIMKAATGAGIVSTMILISDDLDEVDWEIIGNNHTHVSTNWYGHGNQSQYNAVWYPIDGPQDDFHNYTISWQQDRVEWILNGDSVRSVPYAPSGEYPQTPSVVRFGVWAAGDSKFNPNGTVQWAGGETQFDEGPFVATVKSIKVTDGSSNSSSYLYGDRSGSWESIKISQGESKAYKAIHKVSKTEDIAKKWQGLSTGAKIGIAVAVIGVAVIGMIAFTFYCVKQRRAGKLERIAADREWEAQQTEMMAYKEKMQRGGFAMSNASNANHSYMPVESQRF